MSGVAGNAFAATGDIGSLAAVIEAEFTALRTDLTRLRGISADAVGKMATGFRELREQSQVQHELVRSLVALLQGDRSGPGTDRIDLQAFTTQTGALLGDLVRNTLASSERSMAMARQMNDLVTRLDSVV